MHSISPKIKIDRPTEKTDSDSEIVSLLHGYGGAKSPLFRSAAGFISRLMRVIGDDRVPAKVEISLARRDYMNERNR